MKTELSASIAIGQNQHCKRVLWPQMNEGVYTVTNTTKRLRRTERLSAKARTTQRSPTRAADMFPVIDITNMPVEALCEASPSDKVSKAVRGFSQLNLEPSWREIDPSPAGARAFLLDTVKQMNAAVRRSFDRSIMPMRDKTMLDAILGGLRGAPCSMLASNLRQRASCGTALIDMMEAHRREKPARTYYLVTLFSDRWLSFDRTLTIIWLAGMKKIIAEVMRHGGFDGWIGAVEIQTLDESTGVLGRTLLPHFHAVVWTTNPNFDPDIAAAAMRGSGRLKSYNGANSAVITGGKHSSPCNLAAYVLKAPALAKTRESAPDTPSGFRFAPAKLPPIAAARLTEVLSGIYFDELLLSGGDGKPIRTQLRALVRRSVRDRSPANISIEQAQAFWVRTRSYGPLKRYSAVTIKREPGQLDRLSPVCLASAPFNIRRNALFTFMQSVQLKASKIAQNSHFAINTEQPTAHG